MVTRRKSAWNKNQRREVMKTLGRFVSILSIVALGVGTFSGLKVTQNAMTDTADQYLRQYKMFDDKLVSTIGLEEEDVAAFAAMDGISTAEGAVSRDVIVSVEKGSTYVLSAHSITNDINLVDLVAGRMPQAPNECLGDARMQKKTAIGTKITISSDNDEDTLDAFAYDEYTIVGIANTPTYLNMERGNTKLAGGKVAAYVYLPLDGFSVDYFTEVYVSLTDANGKIFSDAYKSQVSAMETPLDDLLTLRANQRYDTLIADAQQEIDDAEAEYQDGLNTYTTEKADAEQELADAAEKLHDAKYEIAANWNRLEDSEKLLADAQTQHDQGLALYEQGVADFESQKTAMLALLDGNQAALDAQYALANAALATAQSSGDPDAIAAAQGQLDALDLAQAELNGQRAAAEAQFTATQATLDANKAALDEAQAQIDTNRQKLAKGRSQLSNASHTYEDNYQEYLDKKAEAEQKFADAEQELADGRVKIDDAKAELADVKRPNVYVLDRETNIGYVNFENDSSIVNGISKVFPVFFFLVAALVTMTTMTRMVEEQRTQIGTLKALGYGGGAIAWKYISYAASAAILGALIGFFGGSWIFPWVIWRAYGMLYGFAPILYTLDWTLFAVSLAVTILCSAGVTLLTSRAELKLMPAELMRPKAPKEGKRVFLERIPFLWKRLGFMLKISLRNVFRYTRRLIMMVLGISGCTALLIAGFGIRDSVANIAADQFDNIMIYDFSMVFEDPQDEQMQAKFVSDTANELESCVFVSTDTLQVATHSGVKDVNVIATDDPDISSLISLHYEGKQLAFPTDESVAISDKLAHLAGVSVGDTIRVTVDETRQVDLTVSAIFDNYVYHYMLMTPATYEKVYGEPAEFKAALADTAQADKHAAAADLMEKYDVKNMTVTADIKERVNNMMQSLNLVIFVIIFCAGALAFVVLFNLSNINITERVREIATIKVLGFYPPEVGAYVFRENLVLTLLGSLAGIPLGMWLHGFIMGQLNFDMVSFHVVIKPLSYLLSVAMTFVFAFGVDIVMRPRMGKINMVESLKAVE